MVESNLDGAASVLQGRPTGPLRKEDFDELTSVVDLFIVRGTTG